MQTIKLTNQWNQRKVAFLGDSITDAIHVGTTKNYWQFLEEFLDIKPLVYGVNGSPFGNIIEQSKKLYEEHADDVDAIIVFAGTNDYMGAVPPGEWYTYEDAEVVSHGVKVVRSKRTLCFDEKTFRGRININLQYLKKYFPDSQIILLTMLHRGFAEFSGSNIQPAECYANGCGLFVESYADMIKEAANVWAVPVIDLNSISGLYPMLDEYAKYFHDAQTDRLHPAATGHQRIALTLAYQLSTLPASFR